MLMKKYVEYFDQDTLLEGFAVYDDSLKEKKPLILVCHDWTGRNEFVCEKAEKLAEMGYVGFALDMYGKGKIGKDKEEKSKFMQPFMSDRALLQRRITAAFKTASQLPAVDSHKIAAIGFCFGGTCALDLARSGASLSGVVSFHGGLAAPDTPKTKIHAKILALHGYNDPMVPMDQVAAFEKEMTEANVDWQMHIYSGTMHGFTNPLANDPGFGTVYNKCSDKRAWIAMKNFLEEIF